MKMRAPRTSAELVAHVEAVRAPGAESRRRRARSRKTSRRARTVVAIESGRADMRWLTGVVRNLSRRAFRSASRRARHESAAPRACDDDDPAALVERAEFGRHARLRWCSPRLRSSRIARARCWRRVASTDSTPEGDGRDTAARRTGAGGRMRSRLQRAGVDMVREAPRRREAGEIGASGRWRA